MEKILQILAVFGLLMLVIWRSIRGMEDRFRRLSYLSRLRPPLMEEIRERLIAGVFGPGEEQVAYEVPAEADAYLVDEESRLLFCYRAEGKLTVYRRSIEGGNRRLQELSVPMDCTGLAWDPQERKIYLEEGGDFFVYGLEE